jgi:hypothetical protein
MSGWIDGLAATTILAIFAARTALTVGHAVFAP